MNLFKRAVRTVVFGALSVIEWSTTDEERALALAEAMEAALDEEEEEYDIDEEAVAQMERDAAYLTTGLITAVKAVHASHEEGTNCSPHHDALTSLLTGINHPMIAIRIIQHLLEIVAATVDDEDIQQMVATIVATELSEDEDDPRHHHH